MGILKAIAIVSVKNTEISLNRIKSHLNAYVKLDTRHTETFNTIAMCLLGPIQPPYSSFPLHSLTLFLFSWNVSIQWIQSNPFQPLKR